MNGSSAASLPDRLNGLAKSLISKFKKPKMTRAILFDLDGLLADTETLAMKVVLKICPELGLDLEPGEETKIVGVTAEKFFKDLISNQNSNLELSEALLKFDQTYEDILRTELKPFPGARSLPIELKSQDFRLAIVSGSTAQQVDMVLSQLNIKELFDVIITKNDITRSKPDPEGFLLAANKLKVEPEECLVFEDSEAGVAAGKAAGMKVIGVTNNGGQDLSQADEVVGNLIGVTVKR
jgi:HAD superfamily hydrolase (TIGR01509 family)